MLAELVGDHLDHSLAGLDVRLDRGSKGREELGVALCEDSGRTRAVSGARMPKQLIDRLVSALRDAAVVGQVVGEPVACGSVRQPDAVPRGEILARSRPAGIEL